MSVYSASVTLAIKTLDTRPVTVDVHVFQRYVTRCAIRFPKNTAQLVGAALFNYDARFAPAPGSPFPWLRGDGQWVEWVEELDLGNTPRLIRWQAYNLDDTFKRSLDLRIETTDFPHWAQLLPTVGA